MTSWSPRATEQQLLRKSRREKGKLLKTRRRIERIRRRRHVREVARTGVETEETAGGEDEKRDQRIRGRSFQRSPLEGKEKKSRPESVKEEQTEEEYSSGGSRRSVTPIAGEEPGSARDRVREGDGREDRGVSEADREVLANPERHGLGFLPRGSVGNHFDRSKPDEGEQRGKGSDRPHVSTRDRAPRRDHRGDTGERKRSRQPKSKGKNKRERGQAWRRAREQERWHPKGRW